MEIMNKYLVGALDVRIVIAMPPRQPISKEDALQLAAWIVALADDAGQFSTILQAVKNT